MQMKTLFEYEHIPMWTFHLFRKKSDGLIISPSTHTHTLAHVHGHTHTHQNSLHSFEPRCPSVCVQPKALSLSPVRNV